MAQFVRDDPGTNLTMSPEPVEESLKASIVGSSDQILPPALIDFQNAELVDLTCEDLLARLTPSGSDAIYEVRINQSRPIYIDEVCVAGTRVCPVLGQTWTGIARNSNSRVCLTFASAPPPRTHPPTH